MEHLLNSRINRNQEPAKLDNLSPEKFGKGAYAQLTYTPSRLADNVLFKEVTTLKKLEEGSSKYRESEAINNLLKDRLVQLQIERDGIEKSLTQQIVMYKKMLHEIELNHEQRIKDIQKSFNDEVQRLIQAKQEQAKYAQSQKEILENRIFELENIVSELKEELGNGGANFDSLSKEHEKLEIHHKNLNEKLEQTERRWKQDNQKSKSDYEELSRKLYNTEVDFKGKIDKLQLQREKEKENIDRLHRNELQNVENKRAQESIRKSQELKDLSNTFQAQASRLNDTINSKERAIDNLNRDLNEEKQKVLNLTRSYTNEVNNLIHEKNRLKEEIDNLNLDLAKARQDYNNLDAITSKNTTNLEAYVQKLKDEIELNQMNYLREKDRTGFMLDDMHREILHLKKDNEEIPALVGENNILSKQVRNLKDLLLESSLEMQKCKEQFLRLGRQKDHLLVKIRELGIQNETLLRLKLDREEEARGWRDTYYLNRR